MQATLYSCPQTCQISRDQEPAQHEEQPQPARSHGLSQMIWIFVTDEDQHEGDGAQTIEAKDTFVRTLTALHCSSLPFAHADFSPSAWIDKVPRNF